METNNQNKALTDFSNLLSGNPPEKHQPKPKKLILLNKRRALMREIKQIDNELKEIK